MPFVITHKSGDECDVDNESYVTYTSLKLVRDVESGRLKAEFDETVTDQPSKNNVGMPGSAD